MRMHLKYTFPFDFKLKMVISCCAFGCNAKFIKGGGTTFHSFPKNEERRKLWVTQLKRENSKVRNSWKLCSKHFKPECFDRTKLGGTWLKADAVPTIFSFPPHLQEQTIERESSKSNCVENEICSNEPDTSANDDKGLKRKFYLGDFTEDDLTSPTKAKEVLTLANNSVIKYRKIIKNLYQRGERMKKKIKSLKKILGEVKKKSLISDSASKMLEKTPTFCEMTIPAIREQNEFASRTIHVSLLEPNPKKIISSVEPYDSSATAYENRTAAACVPESAECKKASGITNISLENCGSKSAIFGEASSVMPKKVIALLVPVELLGNNTSVVTLSNILPNISSATNVLVPCVIPSASTGLSDNVHYSSSVVTNPTEIDIQSFNTGTTIMRQDTLLNSDTELPAQNVPCPSLIANSPNTIKSENFEEQTADDQDCTLENDFKSNDFSSLLTISTENAENSSDLVGSFEIKSNTSEQNSSFIKIESSSESCGIPSAMVSSTENVHAPLTTAESIKSRQSADNQNNSFINIKIENTFGSYDSLSSFNVHAEKVQCSLENVVNSGKIDNGDFNHGLGDHKSHFVKFGNPECYIPPLRINISKSSTSSKNVKGFQITDKQDNESIKRKDSSECDKNPLSLTTFGENSLDPLAAISNKNVDSHPIEYKPDTMLDIKKEYPESSPVPSENEKSLKIDKENCNDNEVDEQCSDNLKNHSASKMAELLAPLFKYWKDKKCLLCGFESKANHNYVARKHLAVHLKTKNFKCTLCGKLFLSNDSLKSHKAYHSGETILSCTVCSKEFPSRRLLQNHQRIHIGKKYNCSFCNNEFNSSNSLKQHHRIHTGEKPYTCTVCSFSFRTLSQLSRHSNCHRSKTLYPCKFCGKTFNKKGLLESCMKSHKNFRPYKCEICNKAFRTKSNLQQHQLVHSYTRRYICKICSVKFKLPHHLRSHMETHH